MSPDPVVETSQVQAWEELLSDTSRLAEALWVDACCGPEGTRPTKIFVGVVSGALRAMLKKGRDHAEFYGR